MSRIRTIKPDFWRNEDLSLISAEAALLAIGLLNFADDEGFFQANPRLINADIFPLRELSVSPHTLLEELSRIGFIRIFLGSDGKPYGEIVNFRKHQIINRPSASKFKELEVFTEDSVNIHGGLTSGKERKGKEKEGEREKERKGSGEGELPSAVVISTEPQSKFDPKKFLRDRDADPQLIFDWFQTRKAKRLTNTETALTEFVAQVITSGQDINSVLKTCITKGWGGFEAAWLTSPQNKPGGIIDYREARAQRAVDEFVYGPTPGRIIDVN